MLLIKPIAILRSPWMQFSSGVPVTKISISGCLSKYLHMSQAAHCSSIQREQITLSHASKSFHSHDQRRFSLLAGRKDKSHWTICGPVFRRNSVQRKLTIGHRTTVKSTPIVVGVVAGRTKSQYFVNWVQHEIHMKNGTRRNPLHKHTPMWEKGRAEAETSTIHHRSHMLLILPNWQKI